MRTPSASPSRLRLELGLGLAYWDIYLIIILPLVLHCNVIK